MAAKQNNNKSSCPFWLSESSSCMKCKGGLLIPLDDHVDVYCTAPNFSGCLQYSCQTENQTEIHRDRLGSLKERRKTRRHTASHEITVTRLTGTSEVVSELPAVATTLDVSIEGMRVSTPVPYANGTFLKFLIHDSSKDVRSGIGQVAWCSEYIGESGYQAGVFFQGKSYVEVTGVDLGLDEHGYL
jgi:hypothetical protein